ncbi:SIMPL domain-containing protein [Pollutimonas sp. M17]|uniref:SIMPL domain-containing protein n=1 Tax=Pollutimonas sp. M17 TaxID=2962065 RepID=UPI0021F41A5B|nr:SIMPL domain-containing protein [Pollutimonas sp. M17]UYO94474.1 SIMPL domain-containing protein [Pollutimonas sp. M17]
MYLSKQNGKWLLALTLCAASAGFAATAGAHDAGGDRHEGKWPQAQLQAEAVAEVAQDTVTITLASEISDDSQAAVASALSKTLDEVMKQAKGHENIKATSGNYRIWPMNDKDGKISNWRGRGEIFLESTDFAAASKLASSLSDRMPIANLRFSVSPALRAKQEEALLEKAGQAFRGRAQALADAFGYAGYDLKEINLGGSGARYEAAPRMMAMAADKSARVPLEAGTEMVSVSIQGSIFLRSRKK